MGWGVCAAQAGGLEQQVGPESLEQVRPAAEVQPEILEVALCWSPTHSATGLCSSTPGRVSGQKQVRNWHLPDSCVKPAHVICLPFNCAFACLIYLGLLFFFLPENVVFIFPSACRNFYILCFPP